jgi:hypothetical protein
MRKLRAAGTGPGTAGPGTAGPGTAGPPLLRRRRRPKAVFRQLPP